MPSWKSSHRASICLIASGRCRRVSRQVRTVLSASQLGGSYYLRQPTPPSCAMTASVYGLPCRQPRGVRRRSAYLAGRRPPSCAGRGACGSSCLGGGAGCVQPRVLSVASTVGGSAISCARRVGIAAGEMGPSLTRTDTGGAGALLRQRQIPKSGYHPRLPVTTYSKERGLTWLLPATARSWTCLNHRRNSK